MIITEDELHNAATADNMYEMSFDAHKAMARELIQLRAARVAFHTDVKRIVSDVVNEHLFDQFQRWPSRLNPVIDDITNRLVGLRHPQSILE